jgi:hypothetical protein
MGLLDQMVALFPFFWENFRLFSIVAILIHIHQQHVRILFLHILPFCHSCNCLNAVKWPLIMILISWWLVMLNIFSCIHCTYSFEKFLLPIFQLSYYYYCLFGAIEFFISIYILDIYPLSDILSLNSFSHFVDNFLCSSLFLFLSRRFFKCNLVYFCFCSLLFWDLIQIFLAYCNVWKHFLHVFFS